MLCNNLLSVKHFPVIDMVAIISFYINLESTDKKSVMSC